MVEVTLVGVDTKLKHLLRQIKKLRAKLHILTLIHTKPHLPP